jgi:hypothetical protein
MSSAMANSRIKTQNSKSKIQNPRAEGRWERWVIVALFVGLGVTYSVVTPIFEASDEIWHYPVVEHIATTGRLPVQEPDIETLWGQEGSQPPLYYLASAALTFRVDTSDLEERLWQNPHARAGIPLDPDNRNLIIHTEVERFPWRGTVLAVHLIRLFGVALGAASVALAYELIRTVWPEAPAAAAMGSALMAFNPMYLFISGSVNNDNLTVLLETWTLLLVARILRDGLTTRRAATLAIVLTAATITKISGLTLVPIVGLGLLIHALRTKEWKPTLLASLGLIGAWLALAGWWYVRNLVLYNELLGIRMQVAIAGGREITLAGLLQEWYGFWVSYWGLFGAVNILMDWQSYRVLTILTLGGIGGLLWWAWQKVHSGEGKRLIAPGMMALYTLIVFVGVVRWTMLTYASQGRLMFPALAAISGLLGAGLVALVPARWQHIAPLPIGGAMLVLAAIAPFRYIAPTYAPPPMVDSVPEEATPVNIRFGGNLALLAIRTENTVTFAGGRIPVTLYWRLNDPTDENYSVYLHALGRGYEEIGKIDTYPGGGSMPTSLMPTGAIIEDRYSLELDQEIETPTEIRVLVGVWDMENGQILDPTAENGSARQTVIVRAGVAIPREQPEPAPQITQQAQVGEFAELLGYDTSAAAVPAGETLELTLYWRGLESTEQDLTVLVQLVGEDGIPLAQADGPPLAGDYPTSLWQPGIWIADVRELTIPEDISPGDYRLLTGFYDAQDPAYPRAEAFGPDGARYPQDAIPLETTISVTEP